MSAASEPTGILGEAAETCRECGYPLAVDQRYCLNCGRRRGEARVDFRRHLPAERAASANGAADQPPPANAPPSLPAGEPVGRRDYAPLAAVGGIAVLGLMLLVGVLIGRGGDGTAAPPPQVVRLGDEGAAEASGEAEAAKEGAAVEKKGGAAKKANSAGGSAAAPGTGNAVVAGDQELQELQEQSPEEYRESSAKLPDEIATGGAPPPEDNKAPGGGSEGTAIE